MSSRNHLGSNSLKRKSHAQSLNHACERSRVSSFAIITTGGTIDKLVDEEHRPTIVGPARAAELLGLSHRFVSLHVASVLRKDSLDLTERDRKKIVSAIANRRERIVIVTHGTDTMIATAKLASQIERKVIIFTGAMKPAVLRNSDAKDNLIHAVGIASRLKAGVYIAMHGRAFDPFSIYKNQSNQRFELLTPH